jgi:hypothetical protein
MTERFEVKRKSRFSRISIAIALSTWIAVIGFGFSQLYVYSHTPGAPARPRSNWPEQALISRSLTGATLMVFLHPNCPCSVATVGELERLVSHTVGRLETHVFFFKPKSKSEGWAKERLWSRVAAIPGVTPHLDEDGQNAERFGARTSGQVFLYDRSGKLAFQGGITPERGHMGDSVGREAILAFIESGIVPTSQSSVFGCSIRNPERAVLAKEMRE